MKSEYLDGPALDAALLLLTPANRLVCQLALATALRIGDCLALTTAQLLTGQRFTVREQKTGKGRRVYIPKRLYAQLLDQAGDTWVFPGRDPEKHRTRQTVWKDLKRAAAALRLGPNLTPHSLRKVWAVREYQEGGHDLAAVQAALNHSDPAVTMLYALADHLASTRAAEGHRRPSRPQ